jgi:excinuclease ABC subunit A
MVVPVKLAEQESIVVRGVRVHNLKNIDFDIPHNALTIVTGVSGSGKSSLAFDTIYAEGQRRYIESLSAYARQFLERIEKPEIDEVTGIAPAIAIRQRNTARTPRSTVGTSTEIYDYLRLLFARVGTTHCRKCGQPVARDTVDQIAESVLRWPSETRFYVLFPLRQGVSAADLPGYLADIRRRGFSRIFQDGNVFEYSQPESLIDVDFSKPAFVLVDRLKVNPEVRQRLIDSVEICFRESGGEAFLEVPGGQRHRFSESFECKTCGIRYEDPEPRLFSFNSPFGACPRCQGFGNTIDLDLNLVIPDKGLRLSEGAVEPWSKPRYRGYLQEFRKSARAKGVRLEVPVRDLDAAETAFLHNSIREFFQYLETKKYKLHVRVFLSRYRGYTVCPDCEGSRLRQEGRDIYIAGRNIADVCRMTIHQCSEFFATLELATAHTKIAERLLWEIRSRLRFLNDVGLPYLTLERLASTLSGGEAQRIQLATSLGSSLVGALYVLDEPSIGLHPRDARRLTDILLRLRDIGNTVLVVEHDAEIMRSADHILDLGPGAGENGGQIVYQGDLEGLTQATASLTGKYLSGELRVPIPKERRKPGAKTIRLRGARLHNLKNVDLDVPVGLTTCITGVSGSGKSTLVHDCLYEALKVALQGGEPPAGAGVVESGPKWISEVVLVDQSPIGRTPRSNPVTYIKAFDHIREVFAATRDAQAHGFNSGTFSFNIPGGRCETCEGDGTVTVEMQFLADVELVCEDCKGQRYKNTVLEVQFKGKNIYQVLQMTVREALLFFGGISKVTKKLKVLDEVGLGYLRLGQSATTLSGGEAQRIKLAAYLGREVIEKTLFIFDEPTTGLHFDDINKLLAAFRRLIEAGGSILIIEHNLDVIKSADWVVDLGPEGGDAGGMIVCAGTPEQVAEVPGSLTGQYLRHVLAATAR